MTIEVRGLSKTFVTGRARRRRLVEAVRGIGSAPDFRPAIERDPIERARALMVWRRRRTIALTHSWVRS